MFKRICVISTPNDDLAGADGPAAGPAGRSEPATGRQRAREGLRARGAGPAAAEAGGADRGGAICADNEPGAVLAAGDVGAGLRGLSSDLVPPRPPRPAGADAEPTDEEDARIGAEFAQ